MPVLILILAIFTLSLFAISQKFIDVFKKQPPQTQLEFPSPKTTLNPLPESKILEGGYQTFQTFNNCGPAALSMALSHYGVNVSQNELGLSLRPYQNIQGDNDDKSVTLAELGEKSKEYGFIPYHRPNGTIEILKNFINYDIPIIVRTWTKTNEDIGHYRVVKGYNEVNKSLIQDDSLQNKNLWYTYDDFNRIWQKFNYEYLVLVPKDKVEIAAAILKENISEKTAWQNAVKRAQEDLATNPNDATTRFNLSVALYNSGDINGSIQEFEAVENKLPFRTLWYQIEPVQAYFEIGKYQRVFEISDKILNNHNMAFSELYIIRGKIYQKQGNLQAAKSEFEKAVLYNKNLKKAKEALTSVI